MASSHRPHKVEAACEAQWAPSWLFWPNRNTGPRTGAFKRGDLSSNSSFINLAVGLWANNVSGSQFVLGKMEPNQITRRLAEHVHGNAGPAPGLWLRGLVTIPSPLQWDPGAQGDGGGSDVQRVGRQPGEQPGSCVTLSRSLNLSGLHFTP